jgi:NADH dehydrogenase
VGSAVVPALVGRGHVVRLLVRPRSEWKVGRRTDIEVALGDVTDLRSCRKAAEGAWAVVHLVGIIRERKGESFEKVHAEGTRNVVAAAREAGAGRFIHMSSAGTGPGGSTPYFRTKWTAERAVRWSGLDWTILRPSLMHGKGGELLERMLEMIARRGPVPIVGSGDYPLQPVWVGDVAEIVAKTLERTETIGRTYGVGGPEVMTFRSMIQTLARIATGRTKPSLRVPLALARLAAPIAERAMRNPPVTSGELKMLLEGSVADNGPVVSDLGFEPAPFAESVAEYLGKDE